MFWMFQCNNNRKRYRTKTYKGKQFQYNNSTLPSFFEIDQEVLLFFDCGYWSPMVWVKFQTQVRPISHIHWKPWIRNRRWPATIHSTWDNPTFSNCSNALKLVLLNMWSPPPWDTDNGFELYTNICGTLLLRVFFCCCFFLLLVMVEEKYLGFATGYYGTGYCTVYAG